MRNTPDGAQPDAPDFTLDDLSTPRQFARRYPDVVESEARLRYMLRHRDSNGLDAAVITRGAKLWLVKPRVLAWFANGCAR